MRASLTPRTQVSVRTSILNLHPRSEIRRMFFRFISAIVLVVLVSMTGVVLEKRILDLRRDLSRQQYQTEILLDQHTALRLRTQQLSSPDRVLETMQQQQLAPRALPGSQEELEPTTPTSRGLPLMRWERPVKPYRFRGQR